MLELKVGMMLENKKGIKAEVKAINAGLVKLEMENGKSKEYVERVLDKWWKPVTPEQPKEETQPEEKIQPKEEITVEETQSKVEKITLTPLETEAMWILRENEYENCFEREEYSDGTYGYPSTWDFTVLGGLSCGEQGAKGVLGSLSKKGLVSIDTQGEYNPSSKQYDHGICLTELGYEVGMKALENYKPEEVEEQPEEQLKEEKPVEIEPVAEQPKEEKSKSEKKLRDEKHKAELMEMRKAITTTILNTFAGTRVKETKTKQYDPIVNENGRIIMEVHSAGDFCRIYVVDPLPEFEESKLFNRKDGSYAWSINWGYEVPVQNTPDVLEECVRIFEAGLKAFNDKEHMKQVRANKKAIREARQANKSNK